MRDQAANKSFYKPSKLTTSVKNQTIKTVNLILFILILSANITDGRKKVSRCKCSSKTFACSQGSFGNCACIPLSFKCDGDFDCGDFSDERDCPSNPCPTHLSSGWFQCDNGQCIKEDWKCDKDNDCMDDSDERDCDEVVCGEDDRMCANGKECILSSWWCDNDEDCDDGSDELSCENRNCTADEFKCGSGECIKLEYRCDQEQDFDCRDGSDEDNCDSIIDSTEVPVVEISYNLTCKDDEYACTGVHGERVFVEKCIHIDYMCDGDFDCDNGVDEEDCVRPCTSEEYTCANRKCISLQDHCDGADDCGDGSDEMCEQEVCNEGELRCDSGSCISKNWRCDGDHDCKDGTDEKDCDPNDSCDHDQFECFSDKRCVLSSWRCDGETDCDDKSDELYCDCKIGQYQCKSGECIAMGKLCNGIPDCVDDSDERPVIACNKSLILGLNVSSCSDGNGGCEHGCKDIEGGQKMCVCHEGYGLASDMRSCEDINECDVDGTCSQVCNNTRGSFICSCLAGYELRPDGRTCKASGPPPALLFTNRIDIRRMFPDRSELQPIRRNLENAIGLDYHIKHQLMFWSDVTLDKIMRSNINGSGEIQEVVSSGLESPGDVAVDWIHDLLYWTDSRTSRIEVARLDGTNRKVLIWEDLQRPRALALHPLKGLMFWTDWGRVPYLGCAHMDGNMRRHLATTDVYWPNGLTIDYTTDQIYWIDAKYHIIETANLDGRNRRPVISSGLRHPFGITLFEDKIYWTDWQTKSVNTANKFTGGGVRTIRRRLFFPMNIRTYHPLRQPIGENKCQSANCSHLCLPNPQNYTCGCPTGFRRVSDTQCAEEIDTFLVFARKTDIRRISFDASERADIVLKLDGLKNAVALDWHTGYIYWSDIDLDTISRCNWDGTNQKVLISSSLDSPAGIAIDWITNKIYWTDSGINRIEVAMLDGSMQSVLVWTGLDRPRAIIVYPKTGHMFWTDWGQPAKIERAGMDGSDRVTIVSTDLKWPNGIAIDNITERIYWADAGTKQIESCDIHGGKRKTILSELQHPFGIALNISSVFWTDWSTQQINYANKYDGSDRGYLVKDLPHLMDVRYYHKYRYQSPNPCSVLNGGCSHLCLLAPIRDINVIRNVANTPYTCACPTGLVLSSDRKTCNTNMNEFLVIARRLDIYVISLDVPYSADVKLHVNSYMNNVVDVAVDPIQGHLYWSDIGSNKISRTPLSDNPSNETIIINSGLDTVDGLALDVDGRMLYWTDDGKNSISVASLDGKIRKVLISENLGSPRALVLHYELGYMYWTDWGNNPSAKIERAGLDGSNRSVIISSNVTWPNGLTIDYIAGSLIWGDAQHEKIEISDLLGRNRRTLFSQVPHPYSLAMLDGYLYWTDWQTRNIEGINLRNTSQNRTMRENMPSMMGIKAVRMNATSNNRCGTNNGGCSHLCLRSPMANIGYVCACPTGVKLQKDGKSCNDLPSEYLLYTSRQSIKRLSLEADIKYPVALPVKNLENAIALDYHYRKQLLFYTDVYLDVIQSSKLDGSDVKTIVSKNSSTMDGLAVDWIANNIFWTDAGLNTINVARLDGSNRKVIVHHQLDEPRAICVHPPRGGVFWTDWGGKPRIEKSFMDGSTRKVLVQKNLYWPNGLTIDYQNNRIFWVDAHHLLNRIESCDLNGKKREVMVSPVPHGFAITFLYDTLYWTDWQTKNIHSAMLSHGKNKREIVLKGIEELMGIKAVSAARQTGTNLCDATVGYGGCQHLCLMRGQYNFTCAIPDEVSSENDAVLNLPTSPEGDSTTMVSTNLRERITSQTIMKNADRVTATTPMMTSPVSKTPVGAVLNTPPTTGHFIGIVIGTALIVFIFSVGAALLICRRLRQKRLEHEPPNNTVSFRNRTYEGTSSGTLSERLTPLTTPSPSLRASSEEGEAMQEEKAFLLRSPMGKHQRNGGPKVEITLNSGSDFQSVCVATENTSPTITEKPPLLDNSLTYLSTTDENQSDSESQTHEYASIGGGSHESIVDETDQLLSDFSSSSKSEETKESNNDVTVLRGQTDPELDSLSNISIETT